MMLSPSSLAQKVVRTSRGFASQIVVSVAAALCVTAISESVWRSDGAERSPPVVTLDAAAVVGLLNGVFTPDGVRNRPRYPIEFETVLGPTSTVSFARFASSEWPTAPETSPTRVASAGVSETATVQVRVAAAPKTRVPAPPVPPVRLAALDGPVRDVPARDAAAARATTPAEAARETRRATILGVALPGFVPTGEEVIGTVASVAGRVAGFLPRI